MSAFGTFGAQAYASVSVETGVSSSTPHALILMLYDGALQALRRARGCIRDNDQAGKAQAISKAIRIIDEGLRASLDFKAGGDISLHLESLYDYMCRRVLHASVENDLAILDEVAELLDDLRNTWVGIAPNTQAAA